MVAAVEDKAAVQLVQGIVIAGLQDTDTGRLEKSGICPCFVPRRLPEQLVGFCQFCVLALQATKGRVQSAWFIVSQALVFQAERQVEERLTVVGIGVTFLPYLYGFSQISPCLVETSAAQIPQSGLIQASYVVGVASQGFLVIVEGAPSGMPVLLQVQSCEIELVVGLGVLRGKRCLGSIGYGTNLVVLGTPRQEG